MIEKVLKYKGPTRWFIFNWVIYFILMLVTTVYCYARLDYVRSQPPKENVKQT